MAIDHRALQSFYDMWTPVMQTLPAVIDAAQREAELSRSVAQKAAEFERVNVACQDREAAAEIKVAAAMQRLNGVKEEHLELLKTFKVEISEAKAEVTKAKKDAAAKIQEHQASTASTQAEEVEAVKQHASVISSLEAEHATAMKVMQAEIADLEKRKAAAEKALDTLRAKLG
jgi:hypothetical protein